MSNFKYCPMCGTQREDGSQFCKNCNFEFLVGKYVKLDDEKSSQDEKIEVEKLSQDEKIEVEKLSQDEKITTEKVSQEEFVESNDMLRQTKDKINCCIAKYLNYELTNQYNETYEENINITITEYISHSSDSSFDDIFEKEYLEKFENLIHDEKFVDSKNIFIQWIGENRGHLPGMVLNQYKVPIQSNIDSLKNVISLDLVDSDENEKFKDLLNEYLDFENEFIENLI